MRTNKLLGLGVPILVVVICLQLHLSGAEALKPYSQNPYYWEYNGEPVAIFGASDDDNLFQWEEAELIEHLDRLVGAGGNQIRNVMSSRDDGNIAAFKLVSSGTYDLDQWNNAYWDHLDTLLKLAHKRQIFVQIELWDRFDYHQDPWLESAFNPANNINYTTSSSGLDSDYPQHGSTETNPILKTVPGLQNNTVVLTFQEAFVKKVIETAAPYDNILFCISNETNLPEDWSNYWASFVATEAALLGRSFPITEMFDQRDVTREIHERTILNPSGLYDYVDISQNSWQIEDTNWENGQYVRNLMSSSPKPINTTKIYGSESRFLGTGQNSEAHAVENFWHNLLGGFATSRFHRPSSHGIGLNDNAIVQLKVARAWVGQFDIFNAEPDDDYSMLSGRSSGEAYLSYISQDSWTLFFPSGGQVTLATGTSSAKRMRWADLETGEWTATSRITNGTQQNITVSAPDSGSWLAVIETAPNQSFDYNAWKTANFTPTELAQSSISGQDASPNNDGVTNRIKHVLGYRPYDNIEIFSIADKDEDGRPGFEFQKNIDYDDFPISIETSTSLGTWLSGSQHYSFEIVGKNEGSGNLPATELIRIRPKGTDSNIEQWFARLIID
ncbi:MAG: hypothetical protein AAGH40_05470 [Verrucomicrobiota bacterium]